MTDYSKQIGHLAEAKFIFEAFRRGWETKASSESENMDGKFDYTIKKGGRSLKVDVKGPRAKKRHEEPDYTITWVEFKNVHGGPGSLYGGEADVMAFMQPWGFILISKEELIRFVEENVSDEFVHSAKNALYRKYTRKGRKDEISMISLLNVVESCKHFNWKFNG